jgi:hypothetical protein
MLPAVMIAIFSLAICTFACWKFQTRELVAILVLVIPLPFYFGVVGMGGDGQSLRASIEVILLSGASPTSEELAAGGFLATLSLLVGLVASLPAFLVGVAGLVYRALMQHEPGENTSTI